MASRQTSTRARGPFGLPPLGVLPAVRRDSLAFLRTTFARYGDVAAYWLGPLRSYLVSHPDAVRQVLQDTRTFTKDHLSYRLVRTVVGDGLLTSQGEVWLRQRRLAQPAFHRSRIAALADVMVQSADETVSALLQQPADQPRDLAADMMQLTLRIVARALFGADAAPEASATGRAFDVLNRQLTRRFQSVLPLPPVLPTPGDIAFRRARRELLAITDAIIRTRRRRGVAGDDLLGMLMSARDLESNTGMTDEQLRSEVLTMLLAGHETTAVALSWALYAIDAHPAVREQIEAEIDGLGGRLPTFADLPQLPYTQMVIDETLRLYPPVYILSRGVAVDTELHGVRIRRGQAVDIAPYIVHRHPEFWSDPETFDPGRFLPEIAAQRHKSAYIPFIAGPRQCIGNQFALLEMLLVLVTLLQRLRLRYARLTTPIPQPLLTLRPLGGMPMRVEVRQS
jgi:cytochrome P450